MAKQILEGYDTATEVKNKLDGVGKYAVVTAASTMAVNAATFAQNSIVKGTSDITITSVDNLDYEVVFDMTSGALLGLDSMPVIGSYDSSKRNVYSILNGTLVIGNF